MQYMSPVKCFTGIYAGDDSCGSKHVALIEYQKLVVLVVTVFRIYQTMSQHDVHLQNAPVQVVTSVRAPQ
jgi:hypothetical protein